MAKRVVLTSCPTKDNSSETQIASLLGRGSVVGSFLGVLVIAVLGAGLAQAGAQEPTKRLVTGAVIVLAVLADRLRRGE